MSDPTITQGDGGGMFSEVEDESKPEFIFENMTLDEIIKLKRTEDGSYARFGNRPVRYGIDDLKLDNSISPIFLLKRLSEDGKLFEMEAKELELGAAKLSDFRAHRWRVTWSHKDLQGISEAPRKMMAKQVAAYDLILQLGKLYPHINLPECKIPAGCLVSPYLSILLEQKCEEMGFGPPEFQHHVTLTVRGKKEFATICYVHDEVSVGRSYDPLYAKRFAVKNAYEILLGRKCYDDEIIRGEKCFKDKDQKYHPIESEANHVYYLYEKVFGEALNESRDPDRGPLDRYTGRFFLKHLFLEQAFDNLQEAGFRCVSSCGSGTAGGSTELKPGVDPEESRWNHYNEFVFMRE